MKNPKKVRLYRATERAAAVFGDKDKADEWLNTPNLVLNGQTPLSLLDSDIGAESVIDILGRIEQGVFS
jgi:putative toxin-antitoxin system antitoxin component (TIGR02293 family)